MVCDILYEHDYSSISDDWSINPNELSLDKQIGSGGFSDVYKSKWQGTTVAVKVIKIVESEKETLLKQCEKEMNILM